MNKLKQDKLHKQLTVWLQKFLVIMKRASINQHRT